MDAKMHAAVIGGAIAGPLGAIYYYHGLTSFERDGGSYEIHALWAMLYDIGGKWAVVGFFGVSGVLCILMLLKHRFGSGTPPSANKSPPPQE